MVLGCLLCWLNLYFYWKTISMGIWFPAKSRTEECLQLWEGKIPQRTKQKPESKQCVHSSSTTPSFSSTWDFSQLCWKSSPRLSKNQSKILKTESLNKTKQNRTKKSCENYSARMQFISRKKAFSKSKTTTNYPAKGETGIVVLAVY